MRRPMFKTLAQVKAANKANGDHWFERSTRRVTWNGDRSLRQRTGPQRHKRIRANQRSVAPMAMVASLITPSASGRV